MTHHNNCSNSHSGSKVMAQWWVRVRFNVFILLNRLIGNANDIKWLCIRGLALHTQSGFAYTVWLCIRSLVLHTQSGSAYTVWFCIRSLALQTQSGSA